MGLGISAALATQIFPSPLIREPQYSHVTGSPESAPQWGQVTVPPAAPPVTT